MSDLKDQYLKFLRLEEDMGLFDKIISGIRFWELSRVEVFLTLFEIKVNGHAKKFPRFNELKKLLFYIRSLFNMRKNPFFCKTKEIMFSGGQRRVLTEDGKWWDIHVDPFLDEIDIPFMSLEYPIDLEHYGPAKTSNLYYFDILLTLGFLRQKLGLVKIRINKEEREFLDKIRWQINRQFEVDLDILKIVTRRLQEHQSLLPLCLNLLRRIRPKLVVMVSNYARKSLVKACKILHILAVEIQHGVISSYHPGYSFPPSAFNNVAYPDYLLVFGDYWRSIANFPIDADRVVPVGYPYLEKKIEQYARLNRKKQILFISQSRIGIPISKFAVELSKIPGLGYNIVYKLHPREVSNWRTKYPWLVDANVEVIDTLGTDLYRLLGESTIQVGVSSTAIYEGLAYGLRTFLIDTLGVDYFDSLIKTGLVEKISTVDEMVSLLREEGGKKSIDRSTLFLPDGAIHTARFLKDLYSRSLE